MKLKCCLEYANYLNSISDDKGYVFNMDKTDDFKAYCNYVTGKGERSDYYNKYVYHLEILPQPYFGDISSPNVLFLALNPSYDDSKKYESNDMKDEACFEISKGNLIEYINNLQNVNFFDTPEANNSFYVNGAWYWYRDRVIGNKVKLKEEKKAGFLNLCPYHSRRYNDIKKNNFAGKDSLWCLLNYLKSVDELELIVVIWGKTIWDNFIKEYSKSTFNDLSSFFGGKKIIYLNKTANGKFGYHINKIGDILKNDNLYKEESKTISAIFKNEE